MIKDKRSPIKELADNQQEALDLCWKRLEENRQEFTDIEMIIENYRKKYAEWKKKEGAKD